MPADNIVLTCAHVLIGGYDLSAKFNELNVTPAHEMLDVSTFGSGTRKKKGGVQTGSITGKGLKDLTSSGSDETLFMVVGLDDVPVTAFFDGITAGSTVASFGMGALSVKYNLGGQFGQLLAFDFDAQARTMLVPAVVLQNATVTPWSTDSSGGTVVAICSSGDRLLYGGFHVTALSTTLGATISGVITANSSSGYTVSNPNGTTRITFSAQSCKAGTFAVPIDASVLSTDQMFWRARITVSTGTSTGASASGLIYFSL